MVALNAARAARELRAVQRRHPQAELVKLEFAPDPHDRALFAIGVSDAMAIRTHDGWVACSWDPACERWYTREPFGQPRRESQSVAKLQAPTFDAALAALRSHAQLTL